MKIQIDPNGSFSIEDNRLRWGFISESQHFTCLHWRFNGIHENWISIGRDIEGRFLFKLHIVLRIGGLRLEVNSKIQKN